MNKIARLQKERRELIRHLPPLTRILRSTISKNYMTCGYKKCRCRRGEKHGPFVYLSAKEKGKLKMYFVPKELENEVKERVSNYNKLWDKLCKICQLNREILWLKKIR